MSYENEQDDDELQAHLDNLHSCEVCAETFHEKNPKQKICKFCLSFGKDMIKSLVNSKKNEKEVNFQIRKKLFQSVKNLCDIFEHNFGRNVVEEGLTLVILYFDLSEYNHNLKIDYNPETWDLNEPLREVVQNYKDNDEQGLSIAFEKLKFNTFKSIFGKNVKEKIKNKHIRSFSITENFCLNCGETKEKYMTDNFCHSCTLINDAIMF